MFDKHHQKDQRRRTKIEKAPKRRIRPRRVRDCAAVAEYDASPPPELPIGALLEIADWILDIARMAADGDPDDIAIVEQVRAFLHGRARDLPTTPPSERDLITAVALAVAGLEKEHGLSGLGELVALGLDTEVRVAPRGVHMRCRSPRSPRLAPHPYCMP